MKNNRFPKHIHPRCAFLALAGFALLVPSASHGAVTVTSDVTFSSGVYTYSYSVSNFATTFDLALVEIPIGRGVTVFALTSPSGFDGISDGDPVNSVTFFEDTDPGTLATFAPDTSVTGFSYQSTFAPGLVTFSALDENGDSFTGTTLSAIPEPSSLLTLSVTILAAFAFRHRARLHLPQTQTQQLN